MYQRVKAIHSGKANPGGDIAATFKALMREYIARHAPEEKQARRNRRALRAGSTESKSQPKAGVQAEPARALAMELDSSRAGDTTARPIGSGSQAQDEKWPPTVRSRHIPAPVKDHVRTRDRHQCTYVGTDGARCRATRHLQFDHVVPFALGGGHEPENLRLLCAAHNRLEAVGTFGVSVSHAHRQS